MCDEHFARIFANFKDFPKELPVFEDFWDGVKFQEFLGVRSKFEDFPRVRFIFQDSWNSRSL